MPSPQPNPMNAPQAGDPSIKLTRFKGLINTVDLDSMGADDLWRATNIDLDDTGKAHRRRGYTLVAAGSFHSLFTSETQTVYGVVNDVLSVINPDYSTLPLLDGVGDSYWSGGLGLDYEQVGTNIYFTGASVAGIIETGNQVVVSWGPPDDFWL